MNPSKFSLADLLLVLGAVGFGFFCFLSLNFLSLGATEQSIVWATVFSFVLGGLAFGIRLLKRTSRNFKTCIIWEWILLFLFVVVAIVGIFPFSHYFAVLEQKDEIESIVIAKISRAKGMFTEYENYAGYRETFYKSHLNSAINAKPIKPTDYYNEYGFVDGPSDSSQVENKMFKLHAKLIPSNYDGIGGIKQVATNWLTNAKHVLESKWAFTFGIVDVLNNVQTNVTGWRAKLIELSGYKAKGENTDNFDYPLPFDDVTGRLSELRGPTPLSIGIAIVLYLLMLMSYIVSNRSTKNHYSLFSFTKRRNTSISNDIDIKY